MMAYGIHLLSDLLQQFILVLWVSKTDTYPHAVSLLVALFTILEMSCAVFNFAWLVCTASRRRRSRGSHGPLVQPKQTGSDRSSSSSSSSGSSLLGVVCHLAKTSLFISYTISCPAWFCTTQLPFALLWAWNEAHQLQSIIHLLLDGPSDDDDKDDDGMTYLRSCGDDEKAILQEAWERSLSAFQLNESTQTEITWFNIYNYKVSFHPSFPEGDGLTVSLRHMVDSLVKESYPEGMITMSYGFLVSPKKGTKTQNYHHDYNATASTIMIPMVPTTTTNATQFLRHPNGKFILDDEEMEYPDPHLMLDSQGIDHLEVVQIISKPFVVLKLHPSGIHRGIANGEDYDRPVFFISVDDHYIDFPEEFSVEPNGYSRGKEETVPEGSDDAGEREASVQ